jgi:segregation and condensation protein A
MDFRVNLETFRGPLELLLYLVRKHELEITEISVSSITEQFLEHITVLEELDVDSVGDFLDVAGELIELKSRMLLPAEDEDVEELEDPGNNLVERLLAYKEYRDSASVLDEHARQWQERFSRQATDLPARQIDPADQPIHDVELWDLVSAFGRILREREATRPANIVYDDTPIQVYMQRIYATIQESGRIAFRDLFQAGTHKTVLVGLFLAILELVRHGYAAADQEGLFGDLYIVAGKNRGPLSVAEVDDYEHQHRSQDDN